MAAPMRDDGSNRPSKNEEFYEVQVTDRSNRKGVVLLAGLATISMVFGFGLTLRRAQKKDPTMFTKGLFPGADLKESGGSLAGKALALGTFSAFAGFGIVCFGAWKLIGAKNLTDFREKMGEILPRVPRKPSEGRTEFESLRDLSEYLIEMDERKKSEASRK